MKNFILKILREPIVQFGLLASLLLYVDINRNPDDYKNSNYQIMIDDNILINVALFFVPIYMILYLFSIYFFSLYKIDQDTHESNLALINKS